MKSRPATSREHVLLVDVRAGHPRGAVDDARVDEEADAAGRLLAEHRAVGRPGADVALDEPGVLREVGLGGRLDLGGRERDLGALHVDLAVAGHADDDELARAVEVREREHDVLERVGGASTRGRFAAACSFDEVDEGQDRRGVRRVEHDRRRAGRRRAATSGTIVSNASTFAA